MKVREIMTESVECASPDTSLDIIAKMMDDNDVGCIPICQGETVIGMITDRDIVIKAVARGKDPTAVKANDIMSIDVISVSPDTDAHEAAAKMSEYQIKRLPIIENGKLVGILALGDLAIERIHVNEAGNALNGISQGIQH